MFAAKMVMVSLLGGVAMSAIAQMPVEAGMASAPDVRLNVQVVSSSGQPVTRLTQQDFSVRTNQNPAAILSVREETAATEPVHAIIVVDSVNVRYSELAYERDQIVKFLHSNGGHLAVPTSIAILTDKGIQLQKSFSRDGNALATVLDQQGIGFREITRAAGFWGATDRLAISLTALDKISSQASTLPRRKFVLWVSPGWPLLSGPADVVDASQEKRIFADIMRVSNELRNANITLYALNALGATESLTRANYYKAFTKGVAKPKDAELGDLSLQVLAKQSGGLVLQGSTDLVEMMTRCLQDSASWYEVRLAKADLSSGSPYHRVALKVDRQNVKVRTRDGYYTEQ